MAKTFIWFAFLESNDVSDVFSFEFTADNDKPDNNALTKFCDYLVINYIDAESKFPLDIWAKMSSNVSRTTNACE